jgi:phage protein D
VSSIVDRSAPGVRITLLPNERATGGTPLDLENRILALSYEDCETKADKVTITLDNFDLSLFERDELVNGATLEVSWGYPGNMAPPRRVVIKKIKGFTTLTVEGLATSVLMNQEAKTRSWEAKTRSDVVREIASEHGFEGLFVDIEETEETIDMINQSAETDARFLKRLAAREHFEFWVDDTGFHWRKRNQGTAPAQVLTWFHDQGGGDIISVNVESDINRRAGSVEVRGRDPLTKTNIKEKANSENVDRETLAALTEVTDPEAGSTPLQKRNATVSVHPTSVVNAAQAKRESGARYRKSEKQAVKLSLQMVGDPSFRAKAIVEVRGISAYLSGKYYVKEVKHTLSSSGYLMDVKLSRDGTGARTKGKNDTKGAQQGGKPNQESATTDTALKAYDVRDPVTHEHRIEYRNTTGKSVGYEDAQGGVSKPLD